MIIQNCGAGEGDVMTANNDEDSIQDDLSYNRYHNSDNENDNDNDEEDGHYIMHTSDRRGKYINEKEADNIEEIYEEASIVGGPFHKTDAQKPSNTTMFRYLL